MAYIERATCQKILHHYRLDKHTHKHTPSSQMVRPGQLRESALFVTGIHSWHQLWPSSSRGTRAASIPQSSSLSRVVVQLG